MSNLAQNTLIQTFANEDGLDLSILSVRQSTFIYLVSILLYTNSRHCTLSAFRHVLVVERNFWSFFFYLSLFARAYILSRYRVEEMLSSTAKR